MTDRMASRGMALYESVLQRGGKAASRAELEGSLRWKNSCNTADEPNMRAMLVSSSPDGYIRYTTVRQGKFA